MTRILSSALLLLALVAAGTAQAQDDSKYGETPEQQAACKENLSLYETYYKQKNYDDAYPFWQEACAVCPPKVSQNMYIKGVNLLKRQMKSALKAKDNARAVALRDSVFLFYDLRIEHFPTTSKKPDNGCEVLGRKAMDWTSLNKKKLVEARPFFEESIACLEERSSAATLNGYYSLLATVLNKAGTPEDKQAAIGDLLNEYLRLSDFIEAGRQIELAAGDSAGAAKYATTQKNLDEVFVQVANCDDMVPVLEGKLAAAPDDIETQKKALRLLNEKGCTDNDIFLPVAEAVYAVEKNADAAYSIGIQLAKKGDYTAALPYFEEAVELCGDCPKSGRNLMKAGRVAKNAGQFQMHPVCPSGRQGHPGNGEPYLLIGDAIASMVSSVPTAPSVDVSLLVGHGLLPTGQGQGQQCGQQGQHQDLPGKKSYPTIDDLFTYGITEGQSITVKCLGETTTARKP